MLSPCIKLGLDISGLFFEENKESNKGPFNTSSFKPTGCTLHCNVRGIHIRFHTLLMPSKRSLPERLFAKSNCFERQNSEFLSTKTHRHRARNCFLGRRFIFASNFLPIVWTWGRMLYSACRGRNSHRKITAKFALGEIAVFHTKGKKPLHIVCMD